MAAAAAIPAAAQTASIFAKAIRTQLAALPDGPALLNSYLVQTGAQATKFDLTQANAAYVYDNALAGILLATTGYTQDARRIGQALAIAQAHDRFYTDGRLRNAYQAGAMTTPAKLPGWWDSQQDQWVEDPYQVSTQAGPLAWAMLLWSRLGMTAPANTAGDWLDDRLRAKLGYYGGFYGFEPHPLKLTWQSTEQNTDLFAAFRKLGRKADSAHAAAFVAAMAGPQTFLAGTSPDGRKNPLIAADAGIWPYLAGLGSRQSALNAIQALKRGNGIGFSEASASIWLEGTAFATIALPNPAFTATINANISPEGYVYATVAPELSTGLTTGPSLKPGVPEQPFNYDRRPSLSATAWAALAELKLDGGIF